MGHDRPAVLELAGVCKGYPGGVTALRNIDLRVERGELVAIVGPSGSGKSTLLHIMGTLDRPSSGKVLVEGVDTVAMSDRKMAALRAHRIGFVFQQFFLLDGMSALDNVAMGLLYGGSPLKERREQARAALTRVNLAHRVGHTPAQLSGGERQRVAIARAVLGDPAIVFADEPTGNLDSTSSDQIMSLLADLNAAGTTILMITHNEKIVKAFPRCLELRDGEMVGAVR